MSVWREMLARAVLASFGIPLLCFLGWLGGWYWYALVAAIVVIGLGEFYSACYAKDWRPPAMIAYAWALVLVWAAGKPWPQWASYMALTFILAAFTISLRALLPPRHQYVGSVSSAVFGIAYIAGGLAFMQLLRQVDVPAGLGRAEAWSFARRMGAVLLVLLPVWASDTGAFLAGGLWGRHKLAPSLSPNKTVEGAIGGLVSTLIGTLLLGSLWLKISWQDAAIFGLAIGVACQLGDLVESALKRDLNLKDFGTIFGPHGGVLDRFDGLILALPAAYGLMWLLLDAHAFAGHL